MAFSVCNFIKHAIKNLSAIQRERAVALTIVELEELENIFALLLLGSFVGFPSPPTFLAVDLLPCMEKELYILHKRSRDCSDMLAEMCGTLGID